MVILGQLLINNLIQALVHSLRCVILVLFWWFSCRHRRGLSCELYYWPWLHPSYACLQQQATFKVLDRCSMCSFSSWWPSLSSFSLIGKSSFPSSPTMPSSTSIYVHNFSRNFRQSKLISNMPQKCHLMIIRLHVKCRSECPGFTPSVALLFSLCFILNCWVDRKDLCCC